LELFIINKKLIYYFKDLILIKIKKLLFINFEEYSLLINLTMQKECQHHIIYHSHKELS